MLLQWQCKCAHIELWNTSSPYRFHQAKLSLCCQGYRGEGTLSIDKLWFLSGLYKVTLHHRVCSIQLNIQHFTETRTQSSRSITGNRGDSCWSRWRQSSATGPVLEIQRQEHFHPLCHFGSYRLWWQTCLELLKSFMPHHLRHAKNLVRKLTSRSSDNEE